MLLSRIVGFTRKAPHTYAPRAKNMHIMKTLSTLLLPVLLITSCSRDAEVASRNLSRAADMFEVNRRVIFYNGITGTYMLIIEGRCSIKDQTKQLEVTCKNGPKSFRKHFLGLSDNVTYFAEQMTDADVGVYHHRIVFKPQLIIPEIDLRTSKEELTKDRH